MNEFQQQVPQYWVRYPEKLVCLNKVSVFLIIMQYYIKESFVVT